jgi:hypothetical protein
VVESSGLTLGPGDRFLRRIRFPDQIKRGIVRHRAFLEPDHIPTLSFSLQNEELTEDSAIEAYREYFSRSMEGDLVGLVWLSYEALTVELRPPLPPRGAPDDSDPVYGHLHCVTDKPLDKKHRDALAKLVTDGKVGGILRECVKKGAV